MNRLEYLERYVAECDVYIGEAEADLLDAQQRKSMHERRRAEAVAEMEGLEEQGE